MIKESKNRRSVSEKQKSTLGQHVRLFRRKNPFFTKVINWEK